MASKLTPEELAARQCLQPCPGDCGEADRSCGEKPGHLYRHSHGLYDYSGPGAHSWPREQPADSAAALKPRRRIFRLRRR